MSVPRKRRLPASHLLTDEMGSMNSRFLSALFPSAAQAHAAAEVLERRGAVLLAMEKQWLMGWNRVDRFAAMNILTAPVFDADESPRRPGRMAGADWPSPGRH